MDTPRPKSGGLAKVCLLAVIAILPPVLIEIGEGIYVPLRTYLVYAGISSLVLVPLVVSRYSHGKVVVYIAFLSSLVVLWAVPWTSRKCFLKDLHSIEPGMTLADAESRMKKYMKGTGWSPYPSDGNSSQGVTVRILDTDSTYAAQTSPNGELALSGCVIYRHSNDAAFNSDWGIVRLEEGKVVGVEFSPD